MEEEGEEEAAFSVPPHDDVHVPSISATVRPLLAVVASSSALVLLYLPRCLLPFLLSPVPFSTLLLLASLLRFGRRREQPDVHAGAVVHHDCSGVIHDEEEEEEEEEGEEEDRFIHDDEVGRWPQKVPFPEEFLGWCVGGPLEVIYEDRYEGQEEEEEDEEEDEEDITRKSKDQQPPFADYSDGRLRDGGFPENVCFRWVEVEEEEEEEMIEISLDDEENLIEIDLTTFR